MTLVELIEFMLQAAIVISSMLAGMFWLASAWGIVIGPPWRTVVYVAEVIARDIKQNGTAMLRSVLRLPLWCKEYWFSTNIGHLFCTRH